MTVDDRRKIFDELMRLLPRIAVDHPTRMSSLRAFCRLLDAVSLDAGAERDERPLARGLPRQACLDLALAGVLSLSDVHRLAEDRIRRPSGQNLRAEVLHLLRCRSERLDGSGPMGLSGGSLDAPVRIFAAACAYVDRLADGWSGVRALASIYGDHALFDEVCAGVLVSILSVYPIGSYVTLDSGEKGRVVAARLDDPLHPIVWGRLRADGAVLEPPMRYGRENPARVVSLLSEPEVGVPGPEETAQAELLQRERANQQKRKEAILAAADRVRAAAQGILTRLDRLPQSAPEGKAPNE